VFVTYPAYIREKARQMRVERDLTIDEIAERLAISRQTIYHWVRDLPMQREARWNPHVGAAVVKSKHALRREATYEQGAEEFESLLAEPSFRDFVCMYIGEGYKRSRNTVSLCNSDSNVIVLADYWIRRFAGNKVSYTVQHHADQARDDLQRFWGQLLRVDADAIKLVEKSNSHRLRARNWRCRHGVMAVTSNDTQFRARLQAWMDCVAESWLELPVFGA
jgi:DNA-binding XRE family transcriptional regulator